MYLTRVPICVARRESKYMLASPYRMHAAVAGCFPSNNDNSPAGGGRILWRVDGGDDGSQTLYIVSPLKPNLVDLDEQVGWPDHESQRETRHYDPFLSRIEEGQRYAFRLAANPVVSRTAMKDAHGRSGRFGHVTTLQQSAWLVGAAAYEQEGKEAPEFLARQESTRASNNGFRVCGDYRSGLQLVVSDREIKTFRQGMKGRMISMTYARFDGILEVTDAAKLVHALTHGIGHSKAFGCGLMTVVPLQ